MKKIALILLLTGILQVVYSQQKLDIKVKGVKVQQGELMLAIYNTKESFPIEGKQIIGKKEKALNNEIKFTIDNLPKGNYAIAVFHDVNSNNKMDKNRIGIPTEGFGFSSNKKPRFGPPNWNDAVFNFPETKSIEIMLFSR